MKILDLRVQARQPLRTVGLCALSLFLLLSMVLAPASARAQAAEPLAFPRNATSINVAGTVTSTQPKVYMLRANAGQQMTVGAAYISSPYQVIVSDARGATVGFTNAGASWAGTLPATGDYYITIVAPPSAGSAEVYYNLTISITGSTSPTPTPPPAVERINFAPGAISATVSGTVGEANPRRYVLRALAGQNMTVLTDSPVSFRIDVTGADGSYLGTTNANRPLTVGLPRTQDYYLTLTAPAGVTSAPYTLRVTVVGGSQPATPTPRPPQAQRISFAPGAISATVYGYVDSARPVAYVLRASAGQNMTVQMSGGGPYQASITGANGASLGSVNANNSTTVRLPSTQDYYIAVRAPADAPGSNFTMTVTIVGSQPQPSTKRITFARGAVSATEYGTTPQNYVLKALRGQTMIVELFTNGGMPATAQISAANGTPLGSATESYSWSGVLPGTQDYTINVASPPGGGRTGFTLRVTIY
jgi:hypothetical protein